MRGIVLCALYTFNHKICSNSCRIVGCSSAHKGTRECRSIYVTRSVTAAAEFFVSIVCKYRSVVGYKSRLSGNEALARQDYVFCPHVIELLYKHLDKIHIVSFLKRSSRKEARLGDVGKNIVGSGNEHSHGRNKLFVKAVVKLSAVCHGRVYNPYA